MPSTFNIRTPKADPQEGFQVESLQSFLDLQDQLNKRDKSVQDTLTALQAALAGITGVPTGTLMPFGKGTAPTGFLLCDGAAVSRTTYAALFAVIGTSFGAGDGSTTFNVPDLRLRLPIGAGTGVGVDDGSSGAAGSAPSGGSVGPVSIGAWSGKLNHTLIEAELPSHSHTIPCVGGGSVGGQCAFGAASLPTGNTVYPTGAVGSAQAFSTYPPVIVTAYIIKT